MAGIYAARPAPDKGQKSDEKTGRKNTSRAVVAAAAYIQQGEEKRGRLSPDHRLKYWIESFNLKRSRALLAQDHQFNSMQLMKRTEHNAAI